MKLLNDRNYNISYDKYIPTNPKAIIVAIHGFCGDKESTCIDMLRHEMNKVGIGLIKFNLPAHGDSEVEGDKLTVSNCLNDLNNIVSLIKSDYKNIPLIVFGTSFGGYLTLLYHYYHPDIFDYIVLRSPAIKMYQILSTSLIGEDIKKSLDTMGYFDYGFERVIKITDKFINELKENDLVELYKDKKINNMAIIHGDMDDLVPIDDSREFVSKHGGKLYIVKGADHRYKKPGELEKVMEYTKEILDDYI